MSLAKLTPELLRQHKGVSFTGITTVFICYHKGKILLGKRSINSRDEHGHWDPGAGGLKHGQSVEENLKRELYEEYGVRPEKLDFIGYMDAFRKNSEGLDTHWLAMYFAVKVNPTKVKINEPDMIDEIGWFDLNSLPSPMHSQFDKFFELHGDKLKKYLDAN